MDRLAPAALSTNGNLRHGVVGGAEAIPGSRVRPAGAERDARTFLLAVCAATALPWLILPFFGMATTESALNVRRLIFVAGPPHVISTFALYFDPAIRPFFAAHRARFTYLPIAMVTLVPIFFWKAPGSATAVAVVAAAGWTAFHFSRQNLGVLSFVHAARGRSSPTKLQRHILEVVGVAGVLGVVGYSDALDDGGLLFLRPSFKVLAAVLTLGSLAVSAPTIWRLRKDPVPCLFFVQCLLFFAPLFFFAKNATVPYAAAHGFQYLVFMWFLVKHRPGGSPVPVRSLVIAGLAIPILGGMFVRVVRDTGTDAAVGFFIAVTAVHFLMDASIWRMRQPFQRAYVRERFTFLAR